MNKVSLIIKREYITRVRNKRFLLVTFLMPIIFIGFIAGSVYFAASGQEETTIAVVNDPGFLKENLNSDSGNVVFAFPEGTDSVNYKDKKFDGILYPELSEGKLVAELHSSKQLGIETTRYVERQLNKALENKLLLEKGID